jgi:general secretion pathway protein K
MSRRSEQGIALIAVLWALTLLSVIAAALIVETRSSARVARNMADKAATRAAADAGIQRVMLDLMAPEADREFRADGTVYGWPFAGSNVRISLRDENGKVNLNLAAEELLAALFSAVGVDPEKARSLADAVADFRDADHLKHLNGAEEADYRAAGLPWRPKDAPFAEVEELQQVLGMTPGIYELVAPDLTVYTFGATINPELASARLTAALGQAQSRYLGRSSGRLYSIRAEAKSSNGGVFVREAVARRLPGGRSRMGQKLVTLKPKVVVLNYQVAR